MKTFLDLINESNPAEILKKYDLENGTIIPISVSDFKSTINNQFSIKKAEVILYYQSYMITMKKTNSSAIKISITESCAKCKGNRFIECSSCYGTGECNCCECDNLHSCGKCDGQGKVECDSCYDIPYNQDKIILEDILDLNQGELF